MTTRRHAWLIAAVVILALTGMACGFNFNLPLLKSTPTPIPTVYIPPMPATQPPATMPPANPMSGLVGSWLDPDTTGTVTTIIAQGDGYAVQSVSNPTRGGNELTETNWTNGVLTWTYCVNGGACVTSETLSLDGDNLNTRWSNDQNQQGYTTLTRVTGSDTAGGSLVNYQDMIGSWLDPDTTGTVTKIIGLDGGLAVDSVTNSARGGNELTEQNWDGAVLSWTYCVSGGNCVTSQTVSVNGDSLEINWFNDQGDSGTTTLQRVADGNASQPSMDNWDALVGKWLDPDTTGTVTTIVAQGNGYAVESVINPDRGVNEVTQSSWENGVLTWTYCPEGMHCIISSTVSVDATTLEATWSWTDGDGSGTTYFSRVE